MLYALKYEKHSNNALVNLMDALKKRGLDEQKCKVSAEPLKLQAGFLSSIK